VGQSGTARDSRGTRAAPLQNLHNGESPQTPQLSNNRWTQALASRRWQQSRSGSLSALSENSSSSSYKIILDNDIPESSQPGPVCSTASSFRFIRGEGSDSQQVRDTKNSMKGDRSDLVRIASHTNLRTSPHSPGGQDTLDLFELHPVTLDEITRQLACICKGYSHSEHCRMTNAMLARCQLKENEGGGACETVKTTAAKATGSKQGRSEAAPWHGPGLSQAEETLFHHVMAEEIARLEKDGRLQDGGLEGVREKTGKTEKAGKHETSQQAKQRRFQDMLSKLNKPAEERYLELVSRWVDPETGASRPDQTWSVLEMFA